MNLLASSANRWRIGRKEAAPTSPTAHRLAGFADHVGQDGEALCQFIVGYRERHERPNHVPVLPTAVKSIRPSCRAFSATLAARSLPGARFSGVWEFVSDLLTDHEQLRADCC
jgi:hypothetical protein